MHSKASGVNCLSYLGQSYEYGFTKNRMIDCTRAIGLIWVQWACDWLFVQLWERTLIWKVKSCDGTVLVCERKCFEATDWCNREGAVHRPPVFTQDKIEHGEQNTGFALGSSWTSIYLSSMAISWGKSKFARELIKLIILVRLSVLVGLESQHVYPTWMALIHNEIVGHREIQVASRVAW